MRKAVQLAVDRDAWEEFKMAGSYKGTTIIGSAIPPYMPPYSTPEEELRTWPGLRQPKDEDIAEANRLLDEVFGEGIRFNTECETANTQAYIDICLFIGDQMKKSLDIDVTMAFYEYAVHSQFQRDCRWDIYGATSTISGGQGLPDQALDRYHRECATGATLNCTVKPFAALNPEAQAQLEAEIDAQSVEQDVAKRVEMIRALDKKVTTDPEFHLMAPFGQRVVFNGMTPDVKGWGLIDRPYNHYAVYERIWLAE